jgi:hypothetical protein
VSRRIKTTKSSTWRAIGKSLFLAFVGQRLIFDSVFEHIHKQEIRKAKDEGVLSSNQLETIVHPNEYFKRSYLLKNLGKDSDVKMED